LIKKIESRGVINNKYIFIEMKVKKMYFYYDQNIVYYVLMKQKYTKYNNISKYEY